MGEGERGGCCQAPSEEIGVALAVVWNREEGQAEDGLGATKGQHAEDLPKEKVGVVKQMDVLGDVQEPLQPAKKLLKQAMLLKTAASCDEEDEGEGEQPALHELVPGVAKAIEAIEQGESLLADRLMKLSVVRAAPTNAVGYAALDLVDTAECFEGAGAEQSRRCRAALKEADRYGQLDWSSREGLAKKIQIDPV